MANLQGRITQQEAVVSVELESPIYSYGKRSRSFISVH